MVYTADGKPLYIPPRKHDSAERTGMQSLLSAIEIEMASGRNLQGQELLDLIHTNFTNEEPMASASLASEILAMGDLPVDVSALLPVELQSAGDSLNDSILNQGIEPYFQPYTPPVSRKRKWAGVAEQWKDAKIKAERIKTVINNHLSALMLSNVEALPEDTRMTRITCSYASVGQKSYGTEKRFLTPAPSCTVSGRYKAFMGKLPVAHMSIHTNESSAESLLQSATFDENMKTTFKALHINNKTIGKSKAFTLKLQIARKQSPSPAEIPYAEFETPEIAIISKASKKASRQRVTSAFIHSGGFVALYNRINSQTVRTKFLTIEDGKLCVLPEPWTAFRIDLVDRAVEENVTRIIQYGNVVTLTDVEKGYQSEPLVVRRLEKDVIDDSATGYVSQMQKVVFESFREPESSASSQRTFLSALNAQRLQKEGDPANNPEATCLPYSSHADGIHLDDSGLWTLVGISSYTYTFLDTLSGDVSKTVDKESKDIEGNTQITDVSDDLQYIETPITPIPTLLEQPSYMESPARLYLQIRDYWHASSALSPPEVWLGSYGPLEILSLQQSEHFTTDAMLEAALPTREDVKDVESAPLLFVRQDGIVFPAGCTVFINAEAGRHKRTGN